MTDKETTVPERSSISYDPYQDSQPFNEQEAALLVGRHLTRLYWHLQQAWLLGGKILPIPGKFSDFVLDTKVRHAQEQHFSKAFKIYDALELLMLHQKFVDGVEARDIAARVQENRSAAKVEAFPDGRDEASQLATQLSQIDPDNREMYIRNVVRIDITPNWKALRASIRTQCDVSTQDLIDLGECLEQGLCRPDVCDYLYPRWSWEVLRQTAESTAIMDELEEMTSDDILVGGESSNDSEEAEILCSISREPGDLAPQKLWLQKLKLAWQKCGFELDALPEIQEFRSQYKSRKLTQQTLIGVVDQAFKQVVEVLTGMVGSGKLKVSLKEMIIIYNGKSFPNLDLAVVRLFEALLKGEKGFNPIRDKSSAFGESDSLPRLLHKIPKELQKLLLRRGSGYPLILDERRL